MNITVLGATGMAGSAIVREGARRGHRVTAAARAPRPTADPLVTPVAIDVEGPVTGLRQALVTTDAVVLAIRMPAGTEGRLAPLTARVLDEAGRAGVRTLVVGGAGPLLSPRIPGSLVLDDPAYVPPQWRDIAAASVDQLAACTAHANQRWTYLSPSAVFEPGVGVGAYRRGGDTLLVNSDGSSRITASDFALAVLDELERPGTGRHITVIEQEGGRPTP